MTLRPAIEIFLRDPNMAIHTLQRLLGWELSVPTRALPADPSDTEVQLRDRTWRADLAFELRLLDGKATWLALVTPSARDEVERSYVWPCLAAALALRRAGPAALLAIVPTPEDLTWARQTLTCEFGARTFTPLAVTADQVYALRERMNVLRAAG